MESWIHHMCESWDPSPGTLHVGPNKWDPTVRGTRDQRSGILQMEPGTRDLYLLGGTQDPEELYLVEPGGQALWSK